MTYYYLAASLPLLVMDEPPPLTLEAFRTSTATVLSAEDLAEMDLVVQGRAAEGRSGFARAWSRADTQLRNAIARARAGGRSVDVRQFQKDHEGFDVSLEKAVTDAYARPNPMEREMAIDRIRWSVLDQLVVEDPFGLTAILVFVEKLKLASRWAALEEEKGRERLGTVIEGNVRDEGTLSTTQAREEAETAGR